MRSILSAAVVTSLLVMSASGARAEGTAPQPNGKCEADPDCVHKALVEWHKRHPGKKKAPAPCAKCDCPPGEAGPAGPKGDKGNKGEDGKLVRVTQTKVIHEYRDPPPAPGPFNVGLGVLGTSIWPAKNYAWAWGPALQLRFQMAPRTEFILDGAMAAGADTASWSPGKTRAWTFHAAIAHYYRPWFALTGGLMTETIGSKPGWEQGSYGAVTGGIVLRKNFGKLMVRLEGDGLLGGCSYQTSGDNVDLVYGLMGSGFISWQFE